MAAVQQHTPSSEDRRSKAFMESMEEEMRRCSEHLQRRQSKRTFDRTLNGYSRTGRSPGDEMNGGEEAGARRRRINTLPRSFTMPSNPETRDIPYVRPSRHGSRSPSRHASRSPRTPTGSMKAPIGAASFLDTTTDYPVDNEERKRTSLGDYRGRSAPPESPYGYYSGSSSSERGYSSRESSMTPVQSPVSLSSGQPRSSSGSPRSSMSPPPVAPKPNGKSRERAWSHKRRGSGGSKSHFGVDREDRPRIIKAMPEDSSNSQSTIPVSNQPINVPLSPMEFPSAEVEISSFGGFGEISPQPPLVNSDPPIELPSVENTTPLESEPDHPSTNDATFNTKMSDSSTSSIDNIQVVQSEQIDAASNNQDEQTHRKVVEEDLPKEPVQVEPLEASPLESNDTTSQECVQQQEIENTTNEQEELTENVSPSTESSPCVEVSPIAEDSKEEPSSLTSDTTSIPVEKVEDPVENQLSVSELSAPEIKSIPKKIKRRSSSKEDSHKGNGVVVKAHNNESSPGRTKRSHHRTLSESKIHITVSSSVNMADIIQSAQSSTLDREVGGNRSHEPVDEKTALIIKDLQIQLREKEEDLARNTRQHEREVHEKDEQIKKLTKENKKIERERWELLKRARDAAERALHLRTQLDIKEGSLRSVQSELDRTRDELYSVKSANTSLRALLSELRAPHPGVDASVQVDLGGTLKRNKSMELAFSEGGLSQEHQENSTERAPDFRVSTSSLGWPERSNSERWERDVSAESASLCGETTPLSGGASSQPSIPWDTKKNKRKRSGLFSGKLRRSTGSKRGSVTSVDGLDMSNSSILQGAGLRGTAQITFPYHTVPPDMKEHWKVLDQARSLPFDKWTLQTVVAWLEARLGMSQYTEVVREKAPSGEAMLSLTDADLEKKLGMSNILHRRKLRLAIDEQKDPDSCHYPHAGKIDHSWVAFEWAHDCGLAHLTEVLVTNLVDGRMLNAFNKEDIRKYLKINKKTDQLSFLSAVELLRMHDFNREAIQNHRRTTNNPLYWTNRDVCDWLKDIQLEEYATNVIGGGVHGALLFLERGHFTSDHLASIIQIPSSKGQLKRHLAGKMARLFTEDISQSVESLPAHLMLSSSPVRSSHGSQSPDRRPPHSPHHTGSSTSPPPLSDCPHPSRKNSLSRHAQPLLHTVESLTQPLPSNPRQFTRTGSGPSPLQQRRSHVAAAERVRLSLRESALRSVSSIHEETTPPARTVLPARSFTPTVLSSTGTTV